MAYHRKCSSVEDDVDDDLIADLTARQTVHGDLHRGVPTARKTALYGHVFTDKAYCRSPSVHTSCKIYVTWTLQASFVATERGRRVNVNIHLMSARSVGKIASV